MADRWHHLSTSPTTPRPGFAPVQVTAEQLLADYGVETDTLDERLRQAYYWIVNTAVISPYYDIEFSTAPALSFTLGDAGATLALPDDASYSSNVLVPLLTFAVGGRCLLIGGPGRGKTTVAVLMGVLAGSEPADVRRGVQQGQPQLTISDLIGIPLPKDLIGASRLTDIGIAWRDWLTRPVKIIDEYNRIPTKTQSALLTMVAEGYVESHDQMHRTSPDGAVESWYFTANDDAGGGTFPVIQALKDRLDVTVQAAGFNSRFFDELVARVEAGELPEDHVPSELIFTAADRAAMRAAIRAVPFPESVRRRLEFFFSHFEFVQHGGRRFEYRTKDVVATAGGDVSGVIGANSGADLESDPGAQTLNGLSVRALQTLVLYSKAVAWFRGVPEVTMADVSAVLPFVLRGKLLPNLEHPRFQDGADAEFATDVASWLSELLAESGRQYAALDLDKKDPVRELLAQFQVGLDGLERVTVLGRITAIESQIRAISSVGKLVGRDFDDLTALKYLHQRYTAYLRWMESS